MSFTEKKEIENTDKKEDTKKANVLETEASNDKAKADGGEKSKDNSLEAEVNRQKDNAFLAGQIIDTNAKLAKISQALEKLIGSTDNFADSDTKGNENNEKENEITIEVDNRYL